MKVKLYPEKCISCGMCVSIAPGLFSIKTGVVTLKKDPSTYTEGDKKLSHEAAGGCPNGVIEIIEE